MLHLVEPDVDGIGSEAAMGGGGCHDDGPGEGEYLRLIEHVATADGETRAGGESRDGVAEMARDASDIVEGEDAVVQRGVEEIPLILWRCEERGGGGIDQRAQGAGESGLAAAGRATEDKRGVGRRGPKGGEEPDDDAMEGGASDGEQGFELFGERGGGADGVGQREGGRGGEKTKRSRGGRESRSLGVRESRRAGGEELEDIVFVVVGEVDDDGAGAARVAGAAEACEDVRGGELGVAGGGGEHGDGGVEGVAAGIETGFVEECLGEVFAEAAGVERPGFGAHESMGDDGEGLGGGGEEGRDVFECGVEKLLGTGFVHRDNLRSEDSGEVKGLEGSISVCW